MLVTLLNSKGTSYPSGNAQFESENDTCIVDTVNLATLHSTNWGFNAVFEEMNHRMNMVKNGDGAPYPILVMTGGPDVDPVLYNQDTHNLTRSDITTDLYELQVLYHAIRIEMPILSICKGSQLSAVAFGGTLHQHYPDWLGYQHRYTHNILTNNATADWLYKGGKIPSQTTSTHHQSVNKLPPGAWLHATCRDGVVECWELEERKLLAVQGHPEYPEMANTRFVTHLVTKYYVL